MLDIVDIGFAANINNIQHLLLKKIIMNVTAKASQPLEVVQSNMSEN